MRCYQFHEGKMILQAFSWRHTHFLRSIQFQGRMDCNRWRRWRANTSNTCYFGVGRIHVLLTFFQVKHHRSSSIIIAFTYSLILAAVNQTMLNGWSSNWRQCMLQIPWDIWLWVPVESDTRKHVSTEWLTFFCRFRWFPMVSDGFRWFPGGIPWRHVISSGRCWASWAPWDHAAATKCRKWDRCCGLGACGNLRRPLGRPRRALNP